MIKLSPHVEALFAKLRLAYFGTGEFAVIPFRMLRKVGIRPVALVTAPDAPVGRGQKLAAPPLKTVEEARGIPVEQPEKLDEAFLSRFRELQPDVAVLTAYGKLVPPKVLAVPPGGFLNLHPSLLPLYRGASPIPAVILAGRDETGVTIIQMDSSIDHGPVVARLRIVLSGRETARKLSQRLSMLAGHLLLRTLPLYLEGKIIPVPQDHARATFTKLLSREDGKLLFTQSAADLARQVRALTPWPGAWCFWSVGGARRRLKVLDAEAVPASVQEAALHCGTVCSRGVEIGAVASSGLLLLRRLQLEGKEPLPAKEFRNGYPQIVGNILE